MSDNHTQTDIIIIGAGAAGLSLGYFLAPHASVVIVEQEEQAAYHASGRSAALYIEGYENPVVQTLTRAGKEFFFTPPAGFAESALVKRVGGLTVAGKDELPQLSRYLKVWRPSCPDLEDVSPTEARDMVPILSAEWLGGATLDPTMHAIDVHELLSGYQRGIRSYGGKIRTGAKVSSLQREGNKWQVSLEGETLHADIVVNAAGPWAAEIGALADSKVPLTPMRRTAAIVPAPAETSTWPLVHTVNAELYFKPESPGLMLCPQDETPSTPMDAYPEDIDVAIAIDRFKAITDHEVNRVMHQWAGLRTFAPDRKPVEGYTANSNGFFWLAGQGGFGIQTSPGLGQLAADAILGRAELEPAIHVRRYETSG